MSNGVPSPNSIPLGEGAFNQGFSQGMNMGAAMAAQDQRNEIYNSCMMGRGWYLTVKK